MNIAHDAHSVPASGLLPYVGVVRFAGPDAIPFLQGQVSNDTRRLSAGAPVLAAYSTPQGRVAALFRLLPHSSGVLALMPREIVSPTLERLRKFVMRAKVTIEDASGQMSVAGVHGAAKLEALGISAPEATAGYAEENGIGVARVAAAADRYWLVVPGGTTGLALENADAAETERDWHLADIREGLPQIYAATREMFVAQMLNLDRIDGISFTKGCYTGQEIIARAQHLGRIKRRLYRLKLPAGTWAIGQAVRLADGRSGRLTELAANGGGYEALAVLNLTGTPDPGALGAAIGDAGEDIAAGSASVDAKEVALPYSLA